MEYKLDVISWYRDNGENKHAAARHFGVDRKRLREWLENEDRLRGNRVGAAKKKRMINAGKEPLSLELDKEVLRYLEEERVAGRAVMNKDLSKKAQEIAVLPDTFKASPMWLKRWKKGNRVSLTCGTNDAQKVPEDYKAHIQHFRAQIIRSHLKQSH